MSPKVFKCIQKSPNDPNKSKTGPRVGKGGKHGVQSTSSVDPGYIQAIYRLHPSYPQHTSGMLHATFRPECRRHEGLHLPDVRRPTIPFCIFFVFLVFLKSLVLCDISCFAGAVLPPSQMVLSIIITWWQTSVFCSKPPSRAHVQMAEDLWTLLFR